MQVHSWKAESEQAWFAELFLHPNSEKNMAGLRKEMELMNYKFIQ